MAYYGKIARLPRSIRDELNRRLDNGEPGVRLIEWLNGLPEVQQLLQSEFKGSKISSQNLSEWKAKGYLQWQEQQERLEKAREFKANACELAAKVGDGDLTDCLATVIAAHYASILDGWNGEITDEMRNQLRGLKGISREVARLDRMKIQREWLALGSKTSDLNQCRYEDSKRSTEEKALQFCLDGTMEYPEAQQAFKQAFDALEKASNSQKPQNPSEKT